VASLPSAADALHSRSFIVSSVTDVAELAKKSAVLWIEAHGRIWPVWHEWVDDAVCVVGSVEGDAEQPIPDVVDNETVVVLLRTKADRALAASVVATVEIIGPGSNAWEPTTAALKAGRLNLDDSDHAIDRWATECRVLRLVPTVVIPASELSDERSRTLPRLS
jgi:hypothetical protein